MKCRPNDKEEVEKNQYSSAGAERKNVGRRLIGLLVRCSFFLEKWRILSASKERLYLGYFGCLVDKCFLRVGKIMTFFVI